VTIDVCGFLLMEQPGEVAAKYTAPIRQPQPITDRQLEIEFLDSGVEAYAFTFG